MIVSGPPSSMASTMASAISPSASSQVIRCHLPPPRSPTRFSGYFSRSEPYMTRLKQEPFWQPRGFMSGTPSSMQG